jgi:hypothetical protein
MDKVQKYNSFNNNLTGLSVKGSSSREAMLCYVMLCYVNVNVMK